MRIQNKYVFQAVNMILITLTFVSLMSLHESIQVEQKNQNKKGYQVFVSEVVLPSTPRIIKTPKTTVQKKEVNKSIDTQNHQVLTTYVGNLSYYASDCKGCSGITASGLDIRSGNIYYQDKTYGTVRIVAGDAKIPFGTIVRMNLSGKSTLAIVLDRGGIGFGKKFLFDVLCESEAKSYQLGVVYNAKVEVLRNGF